VSALSEGCRDFLAKGKALMIQPVDARYSEQPAPKPYEDLRSSRDNALMFAYRQERQRMSAIRTQAPPLRRPQEAPADPRAHPESQARSQRTYGLPTPEPIGAHGLAAGPRLRGLSEGLHDEDLAEATLQVLSATCATCLSADSMCVRGGGVFCGTCNKAALVPRMESLSA
jgi:hypothetical protein